MCDLGRTLGITVNTQKENKNAKYRNGNISFFMLCLAM